VTVNRRRLVGVVSLGVGIVAMAWLVSQQDRFHTRSQESACRQGDPDVCLRLAQMYYGADGVRQDIALAGQFEQRGHEILEERCRGTDSDACFRLGTVLRGSPTRALEAFERACRAGLGQACTKAADLCRHAPDPRLWDLLEKACAAGEIASCFEVASEHRQEERPKDALRVLEVACEKGSGQACYEASDSLRSGSETPDLARAEALAHKAVRALERECAAPGDEELRRGHNHPCGLLANLLGSGRGAARDDDRVFGLWQTACEQGSSESCRAIGDPRGYRGLLLQRVDLGATRGSQRRDCEKGNASACAGAAAEIYLSGNEVSGDPTVAKHYEERATKLFLEACEKGDPGACEHAGDRLRVGLGAPRDVAAARKAYDKAKRAAP
jgi:TPR repeat protein